MSPQFFSFFLFLRIASFNLFRPPKNDGNFGSDHYKVPIEFHIERRKRLYQWAWWMAEYSRPYWFNGNVLMAKKLIWSPHVQALFKELLSVHKFPACCMVTEYVKRWEFIDVFFCIASLWRNFLDALDENNQYNSPIHPLVAAHHMTVTSRTLYQT